MPRPLTDRGKGSYWTVNDNVDPRTGVHRIRKKRSHKAKSVHSDEHDTDYPLPEETNAAPPPTTSTAGFEQPQVYEQPAVVQPDPTAPPVIYMPAIPQ